MKTNIIQYDEDTPAKVVLRFLARASVPRVVVVRDGRPTGVISRATLLRWLRNWSTVHRHNGVAAGTGTVPTRRAAMLKAADAATDRLVALRRHLTAHEPDFVSCAVAEATRLENLAQDILAHCRGQDRV